MPKHHNATYSVKSFMNMFSDNELSFDSPVQRPIGQWKLEQKSLLIHSILMGYEIPSIYAVEDKLNDTTSYSIIDGKQRLNTLYEFVNEDFNLDKNTPTVRVKDREYDIAQNSYTELPPNLKDMLDTYMLKMTYFIDITDEEIFEMFYRLNNGTPLSTQQKAKSKMNVDAALFINQLTNNDFVKTKLKLTDNQRKKNEDEVILELAMMLIDEEYTLGKYNTKDTALYMESIHNKSEEFLNKIKDTITYLEQVYEDNDSDLELKKLNAPMLIAIASEVKDNISPDKFYNWTVLLREFIGDKESEYAQYADKSTSNKGKVEGRMKLMKEHFNNYFNVVGASAN